MTVCIATLFQWNYAPIGVTTAELHTAAITMSDRLITAGDVQYAPQRQKTAHFGNSILLIAGDYGVHSQAIQDTEKEIKGRILSPQDIARIYGRSIQGGNRQRAENEILAPLGLNLDMFLAQQKDYSEGFVSTITSQIQNRHPSDVEALIVGSDGTDAHIYHIDAYGNETCLDGVGFGAIGIGAWHAKARLMQAGHTSTRILAQSLAVTYAAKKVAELAPGVGSDTDINFVLKDAIFPIWGHLAPELDRLITKYAEEARKLGESAVAELQAFIDKPPEKPSDDAGPPGRDAQAEVSAGSNGAKAARRNEAGEKEIGQKAAE